MKLLVDMKKLLGNDKKNQIVQKDIVCTRNQTLQHLAKTDFCDRLRVIPGVKLQPTQIWEI